MKLGFLGTGTITSAIVTGLNAADSERHAIYVSPRNADVAAGLSARFPEVTVAATNQQVLDESEVVVVSVRPQIAPAVLAELHFRRDHTVISLVSGLPVRRLSALVAPAVTISRAVPLPSTAKRRSPTAVYPGEPVTVALFASLGAAFAVDTEPEFDVLCTATATMAAYFAYAEVVASWLTRHSIRETMARDYVARIFSGLAATAVESPGRNFADLAADHATRGGTNEQVLRHLTDHGVFIAFSDALDAILLRVTAASR